ncbi:hypothetical protein RAS1_35180 [Phycisphaerae bacterium RAS1]|nr:hypothetical protein RAS1_35180 [Phycisphaerae bacterium RAS1]
MVAPLMLRVLLVLLPLMAIPAFGQDSGDAPSSAPAATAPASAAAKPAPHAEPPPAAPATAQPPANLPAADPPLGLPASPPVSPEGRRDGSLLAFNLDGPAATWLAAIAALVLLLRTSPWRTIRNLDALVLAGMCLLIPLRDNTVTGPVEGQVWQPWAYLLLSIACAYWMLRGFSLLRSRFVEPHECNVAAGGMLVLVLVGLVFGFQRIATAPVSAASEDGVIGGLTLLDTGKLPYGEIEGADGRAPLLYAVHAGALRVFPNAPQQARSVTATPDWAYEDERPIRGVNGLLFVLEFIGLYLLGRRLHSAAIGLTVATLFCLFPAAAETFARPDVMLPAVLSTWALLFATMGRLGPLMAAATAVTAGGCWPTAWLLIPVLMGSALRRGWHTVGCVTGLLLGAAGQLAMVYYLVQPSLPRADAAMNAAGFAPTFAARSSDRSLVTLDRLDTAAAPPATMLSRLWRGLFDAEMVSVGDRDGAAPGVVVPNGVDAGSIPFRQIRAAADARRLLNAAYRDALRELPPAGRLRVNLRTMLEQLVWPIAASEPARQPPWSAWRNSAANYDKYLDYGPLALGVLSALVTCLATLMLATGRGTSRELVGGAIAVACLGALATQAGVADHWAWLLPIILGALAAHGGVADAPAAGTTSASSVPLPPISRPGPPRITVE